MFRSEQTGLGLVVSAAERIREAVYDLEWAIEKLSAVHYESPGLEEVKETLYGLYGRLVMEHKENESDGI
jgi:hypothetical protein